MREWFKFFKEMSSWFWNRNFAGKMILTGFLGIVLELGLALFGWKVMGWSAFETPTYYYDLQVWLWISSGILLIIGMPVFTVIELYKDFKEKNAEDDN